MLVTHWGARIGILTTAHVVGTLPIVSVMAMAPVIQSDLGLSVTQVGLLVSGYYMAQTIGAFPAGGLADRIGVGSALLVSHALLIAGALVFSLADAFSGAVAGTVVMGFGYSIVECGAGVEIPTIREASEQIGVKECGGALVRINPVHFGVPGFPSGGRCSERTDGNPWMAHPAPPPLGSAIAQPRCVSLALVG